MKKKYKVTIEETLARTVEVEAESKDDAINKAEQMWIDAQVVLDGSDFTGEPKYLLLNEEERKMEDHVLRMINEENELDTKITKLDNFLNGNEASEKLGDEDRSLMGFQLTAMIMYHNILLRRIEKAKDGS